MAQKETKKFATPLPLVKADPWTRGQENWGYPYYERIWLREIKRSDTEYSRKAEVGRWQAVERLGTGQYGQEGCQSRGTREYIEERSWFLEERAKQIGDTIEHKSNKHEKQ